MSERAEDDETNLEFQNETQPQASPFSCNLCGRSYTRLDHLARHFRSHTQEKPFTCTQCDQRFARADVLQRHVINHGSESPNKRQRIAGPARVRVSRACNACAESKLKCEGGDPCQRCQKRGTACRYKSHSKRSSTSAATRNATIDIIRDARRSDLSIINTEHDKSGSQVVQSTPAGPDEARVFNFSTLPEQIDVQAVDEGNEYQASVDNIPSIEATTSMADYHDTGLADFLRDIMMPDAINGDILSEIRHDFFFSPKDVLDFGVDTSFAWQYNAEVPQTVSFAQDVVMQNEDVVTNTRFDNDSRSQMAKSGHTTPTQKNSLSVSAQAFKESLWNWIPTPNDHGKSQQYNLAMPLDSLVASIGDVTPSDLCPPLSQIARDQILACVLETCDAAVVQRVVSAFPSADLMTNIIHNWILYHKRQKDTWLHLADFDPNKEPAVLLICIIAAGASISKFLAVRKLAYAFHEVARAANERLFESDNRNIRSLRPMQGLALTLDVGIWSGDRRRMEIAESFSQCLVTMMRRGGSFQQSRKPSIPTLTDDANTLAEKWRAWIETESINRLVAHVVIRDTETSMAVLGTPLLSPAEITVSLPLSGHIWTARTANEWRDRILLQRDLLASKRPSLRDCIDDASLLTPLQNSVDLHFCNHIILCGMWSLAWHYRQLTATLKSPRGTQNNSILTLNLMQQEIARRLEHFLICANDQNKLLAATKLIHQRQLMILYISLLDLQTLAGKAGEDEARKVFPQLSQWAQDRDSRQACWHAGQIIRTAREVPPAELQGISAVIVYHASIVLWAYSILTNIQIKPGDKPSELEYIHLDQDESPQTQRWIFLGRGDPVISSEPDAKARRSPIPVRNAKKMMSVVIQLLRTNNRDFGEGECPPLVENLNKLMRTLGNAAKGMHRVQGQN